MERTHRALETIKTAVIVVLTLSAVLLLSFYWTDFSFESLFAKQTTDDTPVQTPDAPKTREIIAPAEIGLNLTGETGGAFATLLPEEYNAWQIASTAFASFSRSENALLEETTETSYSALLGARSVRMTFAYSLPFDGFCKQFGIASAPFDAIDSMDEILYSEATPDSLYVVDRTAGAWYRLIGEESALQPFLWLIDRAAVEETGYNYTVTATLGEPNGALLPLEYTGEYRVAAVEKEFHEAKRDTEADRFAQTFFDNSLDFVRRVEDSKGLLTYIYNYSRKVLTVSMSGVAEYREELADATVSQGFYASLGTALSFVAEHGGWEPDLSVDGEPAADDLKPYLLDAYAIASDHRTGFRYAFGFRAGDEVLFTGNEAAIVIDVYDGQVTYYRRAMFAGVALTKPDGETMEPCSPANALAGNSDWTYEVLAAAGVVEAGATGEDRLRLAARALTRVKAGYLTDSASEGDTLYAASVWAIRAGNVLLFYDLLSGEPVSYAVDAK